MGKSLEVVIEKCRIKAVILEKKEEVTLVIDVLSNPKQSIWIGKRVGDTYKIPNVNITYMIVTIEDSDGCVNPPPLPPLFRERVFWVFQNQRFEEEAHDGYISAPLGRIHHWKRLTEVRPGHIIIHSYQAHVVAVSVVKDTAYRWLRDNVEPTRRIDCEYHILKRSISISDRINENICLCAGGAYQPFNSNGTGNQGYLYDMTSKLRDYYISEIINYNPYIVDEIPELKKYQTP